MPAVLPFALLSLHTSVSKEDIINALNGKTKTRGGTFICSKKALIDSMLPIINEQDCFFLYVENINEESTYDEYTPASPLKASFAVEFPFKLDSKGKMKFNFNKNFLTHLSKQEIATKMVNTYKIFELAKTVVTSVRLNSLLRS